MLSLKNENGKYLFPNSSASFRAYVRISAEVHTKGLGSNPERRTHFRHSSLSCAMGRP